MIELDYVDDGAIACATLKRPPANAFTADGLRQLQETVAELNANPRVRALVITGDGPKFFSAGADSTRSPTATARLRARWRRVSARRSRRCTTRAS